MYADKMTGSMQRAIDETDRRRSKQVAHNLAHGITPKGVTKRVMDLIDGIYQPESSREALKASQTLKSYGRMSQKELSREIKRVERDMLDAARNLEFEQAAQLRDQLKQIRGQVFGVVEDDLQHGADRDRGLEESADNSGRKKRA